MATYSTNQFKSGLKIMLDASPYSIVENEFVKPGKKDGLEKGCGMYDSAQYILGTLIIRVVAARDLQVRLCEE